MNMLKVEGITKKFGGLTAINNCTFEVKENSITGLIGPNGAGKTTMFDVITGFIMQDSGQIKFREASIGELPAYRRARLGIARTFQAIRVFPELSALDNVLLAFRENSDGLGSILFRNKNMRELKRRAIELLDVVHLGEKARTRASSLSYGQQKLLEIIRAYATGADLFLLDEPAAGVNRTMLHSIINIIKKLKREGKTVVIVEHDMGFIMELCERIIVMDYGKEIAEGTPHQVQNDPKVLEAYLGVKEPLKNYVFQRFLKQ